MSNRTIGRIGAAAFLAMIQSLVALRLDIALGNSLTVGLLTFFALVVLCCDGNHSSQERGDDG